MPGQGGLALEGGSWSGAAVGAGVVGLGVGGAGVVGLGVGGAAFVGAAVGAAEARGPGPEVGARLATAMGPGVADGAGPPDSAGPEASGVSPGPGVGSVPGGCEPDGPTLGLGEPAATGGALTDGIAVACAVSSVGPRDPARPSATVARMMLRAPRARTRRVRCGPVTRDTAPSVGPRRRSNA